MCFEFFNFYYGSSKPGSGSVMTRPLSSAADVNTVNTVILKILNNTLKFKPLFVVYKI